MACTPFAHLWGLAVSLLQIVTSDVYTLTGTLATQPTVRPPFSACLCLGAPSLDLQRLCVLLWSG